MKNFVEELRWRGMIQDIMPGTEEKLMEGPAGAYVGIDPTADSLHICHLVSIMILKHFQACGHKPFALVGGATGMIGDPSMKSQERNLLDEQTLAHNVACIKKQLSRFLDFDSDAPNKAELVNNYDWMKDYTFIDFTRDIGKHITVNYMMAKDSVKKRLSSESREGMSFTEFTYQLLQGYDYLYLYEHKGCLLQMGGADQWGNITTGSELIRRILGKEAYALTCPLITKADGGKFGKTEKGNIWLDPARTSPYQFYQFWLNVSDADAERYIKIFTMLSREEIEDAVARHAEAPHLRQLQKLLAKEVTIMVHGEEEYERAVAEVIGREDFPRCLRRCPDLYGSERQTSDERARPARGRDGSVPFQRGMPQDDTGRRSQHRQGEGNGYQCHGRGGVPAEREIHPCPARQEKLLYNKGGIRTVCHCLH